MARLAQVRDDVSGKLTTGGSTTAFTLTTNQGVGTPPTNGQQISFRPGSTNGASVTLAVDGGAAYAIQSAPGVAVAAGALLAGSPYTVVYVSATTVWLLVGFFQTVNLDLFGTTRGSILERGASAWGIITPGAIGTVFTSLGAGADPAYQVPPVITPQGYLTAVSGQPVTLADILGATTIYYTPDVGNSIPLFNGTSYVNTVFGQLTIALTAGAQLANQIYDVFVFLDGATVRAGFSTAWTTPTAGAGARGTGGTTTELLRVQGLFVNANAMTVNYGATTFALSANRGTYVGSIFVDATVGNVSQHVSYSQARKWGIWNAYNRKQIQLKAGDPNVSWPYASGTPRPSNNDTNNKLTLFSGLPEEPYDLEFRQITSVAAAGGSTAEPTAYMAIGFDSTTTASGFTASYAGMAGAGGFSARYLSVPKLGINVVTSLEANTGGGGTSTFFGTEANMLLTGRWRG